MKHVRKTGNIISKTTDLAVARRRELYQWFDLAVERVQREGTQTRIGAEFWKDFQARLAAEKSKARKQ